MQEQWKPVPCYEGYYEASTEGKVRSVERVIVLKDRLGNPRPSVYKSKMLKPCERTYKDRNIQPRLQVVLSKDCKPKSMDVHRIIAITFIDNPLNLDSVNHKDGNPFNNKVDNLEWVSKADNNRHAFKNNLIHTQKLIAQIDVKTGEVLKVFPGESEACRRMGVSQGKIRRAIQEHWKLHGFYWKYYVDNEGVTTIEPWKGFQAVE